MPRFPIYLMLLLAFATTSQAEVSAEQQAVMDRLGELNGVALACRYFDQTKKIKKALIEHLPKRRELGQMFDDRTNESFLTFKRAGQACPSPVELAADTDAAIAGLPTVFSR